MSKTARTLAAAGFILGSAFPAFAQQTTQAPSKEMQDFVDSIRRPGGAVVGAGAHE